MSFHSKSRGISPILSTILLIALVIVGGALTFIILSGILTQATPLDLEVEAISDFGSENGDVLVDRFRISIKNLRTEIAVIKRTEIKVIERTPGTSRFNDELPGWRVIGTAEQYILAGKDTINLVLNCSTPKDELLPRANKTRIRFNAYRSGDTDGDPKIFESSDVVVGQTYGPVGILVESTHALDSNLTLTISNNGTTALNLAVELNGEPQFLFNNLTAGTSDSYTTTASFSLDGASIDADGAVIIGSGTKIILTWYVNATAGLTSGTYYVTIRVTDSSLRTMAFTLVSFVV